MENQPQHHRRDHPQQDMDQRQAPFAFALVRRMAKVDADQAKQATPEHHYHRQDRAQLDHHLKGFGRIAFEPQQVADDDHVASTGDR